MMIDYRNRCNCYSQKIKIVIFLSLTLVSLKPVDMEWRMWLEVVNEVSEKGTGFKACSPHVKFKSSKSSVLLSMLCYKEEKVILFVDTEFLFIYFIFKFW